MAKLANCGCVYHAEQGTPCRHDQAYGAELAGAHAAPTHTPVPWVVECSTLEEARESGGFTWAHPDCWGPSGWTNETRVGSVYRLTESGVHTGLPGSIEVSEANAHLIAAAPEMYEALTAIRETIMGHYDDECEYCRMAVAGIDAAIAKAEGR